VPEVTTLHQRKETINKCMWPRSLKFTSTDSHILKPRLHRSVIRATLSFILIIPVYTSICLNSTFHALKSRKHPTQLNARRMCYPVAEDTLNNETNTNSRAHSYEKTPTIVYTWEYCCRYRVQLMLKHCPRSCAARVHSPDLV